MLTLLSALLSMATSVAAANAQSPMPVGKFAGWAEVDATGHLRDFEPDGAANPAIVRGLRAELEKTPFVPAQGAEGPMAVRTFITGSYELREAGDEFVLRIREVRTAPKITSLVIPRPITRVLVGLAPGLWGRVSFQIDAEGAPTNILLESPSRSGEFNREMRQAIAKWRFDAASVALFPSLSRYRQDFGTRIEDGPELAKAACPEDAPQGVHVKGQLTCLPQLDVVWSQPERLGRDITVQNP